jgi:hypothetical protein
MFIFRHASWASERASDVMSIMTLRSRILISRVKKGVERVGRWIVANYVKHEIVVQKLDSDVRRTREYA